MCIFFYYIIVAAVSAACLNSLNFSGFSSFFFFLLCPLRFYCRVTTVSVTAAVAKKLLQVHMAPLRSSEKEPAADSAASTDAVESSEDNSKSRRRRKLYTLEENTLTATPAPEVVSQILVYTRLANKWRAVGPQMAL